MLHFRQFQVPVCCHFSGYNIYSLYVTIQSFAHMNIHRFVEQTAFIIQYDDECYFAGDMVLIFLPQLCMRMYVHIYVLYMCISMCMYSKVQTHSLKNSKPIIQKKKKKGLHNWVVSMRSLLNRL
jgi:hypothetical protein